MPTTAARPSAEDHAPRRRLSRRLRMRVLERDGFRCVYCGAGPRQSLLEVDHVIPRVAGGTDDSWNLVTACQSCNGGKGTRIVALPDHLLSGGRYRLVARCPDEQHPGPFRLHRLGPDETPGRDVVIVCETCRHLVVGWTPGEASARVIGATA